MVSNDTSTSINIRTYTAKYKILKSTFALAPAFDALLSFGVEGAAAAAFFNLATLLTGFLAFGEAAAAAGFYRDIENTMHLKKVYAFAIVNLNEFKISK